MGFVGTKDDGSSGDNYSYDMQSSNAPYCKNVVSILMFAYCEFCKISRAKAETYRLSVLQTFHCLPQILLLVLKNANVRGTMSAFNLNWQTLTNTNLLKDMALANDKNSPEHHC